MTAESRCTRMLGNSHAVHAHASFTVHEMSIVSGVTSPRIFTLQLSSSVYVRARWCSPIHNTFSTISKTCSHKQALFFSYLNMVTYSLAQASGQGTVRLSRHTVKAHKTGTG